MTSDQASSARRGGRVVVAVAAVAALGLGWWAGAAGGTAKPAPTVTISPSVEVTVAQPPPPGGDLGEGVLLLGVDVQPGIYQGRLTSDAQGCYWQSITVSQSGEMFIRSYGSIDSRQPAIVAIDIDATDDRFVTYGCTWERLR